MSTKIKTFVLCCSTLVLTACPQPHAVPPPSFPPSWETLIRKGDIEQEYWRYPEAEYYYSQAVTRAQEFGADDARLARSLRSLSSVVSSRGNYAAAKQYGEQALGIYRHLFGPESGEVGMTEYILGSIAAEHGSFSEAKQLYMQSQRHIAAAYGPEDPRLGQPMIDLAGLYLMTNRMIEAENLLRQVVTLSDKPENRDPSRLSLALRHLGALLLTQKRLDEA
ncbi:MAG: tetratricopeptide repeat protein, partial [Nitrospira sp.]|nr:tetratricopeptide repeat protein [Nitrospira sp.]